MTKTQNVRRAKSGRITVNENVYASEAHGVTAEVALGTAGGLDMSSLEYRTSPELLPLMMKAMPGLLNALPSPIEHYWGGTRGLHDFGLRDGRNVQLKSMSGPMNQRIFPPATEQLAYDSFIEHFECNVEKGLTKPELARAIKQEWISRTKEIMSRQLSNFFRSDFIVYVFGTGGKRFTQYSSVVVSSIKVALRKLDLDRVCLEFNKVEDWIKRENQIAYHIPGVGFIKLGGIVILEKEYDEITQKPAGKNCVQFYLILSSLLSTLDIMDMWGTCPRFKDCNKFIEPTLFL